MNIEFVTNNFLEHNINPKDLQTMVNKFIKFHKKMLKGYDTNAQVRNSLISLINDVIYNRRRPNDFVLCIAHDAEINKSIGFSLAQKKNFADVWHVPSTYLEEEYRGKSIENKKIIDMMYKKVEEKIKEKGGKTVNCFVYGSNMASLKARTRGGFEIKSVKGSREIIINPTRLDEITKKYKDNELVLEKEL